MTKMMNRLAAVGIYIAETAGKALAATNNSFDPNLEQGKQNLMGLQYADKAQWILDTLYAFINLAAILALLVLVVKFYLGGWDSIETEIKSRRAFTMIIVTIIGLKIGLMIINVVLGW